MKNAYIILLAPLLIISGCSTSYQEMGFSGGVSATRLDATTFRIAGRGNAFTSPEQINDYVLLKAAEETIGAGYGHFQLVDSSDQSRMAYLTSPGTATTTYSSYQAATTFNPPTITPMRKPGETIVIKMFPGPKPANAPASVYDAKELITYISPRVK